MDLGSIFLILALLVLVGMYVSRPLVRGMPSREVVESLETSNGRTVRLSALLAERDRILTALQELDFDADLGKIPEEDYPGQRASLMEQGAAVLQALDEFQGEDQDDDIDARMEAAIAARRMMAEGAAAQSAAHSQKPSVIAGGDDDLEAMLANRRRVRQEKASGFCPQCGGPVQKSDRFCPKCGADVSG